MELFLSGLWVGFALGVAAAVVAVILDGKRDGDNG
jgi:hypothetical protein